MTTTTVGVLLTIEAKPGREEDVANLFAGARSIVQGEPDTGGVVRAPPRTEHLRGVRRLRRRQRSSGPPQR